MLRFAGKPGMRVQCSTEPSQVSTATMQPSTPASRIASAMVRTEPPRQTPISTARRGRRRLIAPASQGWTLFQPLVSAGQASSGKPA